MNLNDRNQNMIMEPEWIMIHAIQHELQWFKLC